MIFVGAKVDFLFRTRRKATKNTFECGINEDFNILLYPDYTAVVRGVSEGVCFVIPVHYPSFVFTFDQKIPLEKSVDRFFEFGEDEARSRLQDYVARIENRKARKIPFLKQ